MADGHVALWLSTSIDDVQGVAWPGRPAMFVRFNLNGLWPVEIDGVPVVAVSDLTPRGIKDDAYFAAVRWHGQASRTVGANGRGLREPPCVLGVPLWWSIDLLVHDTVVLWIRAIEAVHHVLARLRPRTVSVWGNDHKLEWMRDTVLAVLRQQEALEVLEMAPADAEIRARRRWREAGADLIGAWEGSVDPAQAFRRTAGARSHVHPGDGRVRLVSLDDTQGFTRALGENVSVLDVTMRRLSGPDDGIGFALDDGRARQTVHVGARGVRLGTGEFHAHPTTSVTRYTLELTRRSSTLYVDNAPVLRARVLPGEAAELSWGHVTPTGDTESEWLSVAWGRRRDRAPRRGLLARLASRWRGHDDGFFSPEAPVPLAPLRRPASAFEPSGEPAAPRWSPPAPGAVVVMTFGDELRWFEHEGRRALYDQFSDNIAEAFERRGLPTVRLALNPISPTIPVELCEVANVVELRRWHRAPPDGQVLTSLVEAWRAWRGHAPGETRFPEYRGVSIDGVMAGHIESLLPHLVAKVDDARALAAFCEAYRPRAVVFTHFVTSQRHLIAAARRSGALTIGPAVGCDSQDHLFYGIRDVESHCPRADLYSVWGERELEALACSAPLDVAILPSGRTRQDVFASRHVSPSHGGWLQRLGLPADARRAIVFGDVLCSTNHAQILTSGSCEALLRGILKAVAGRPDVHVLYKPWRGDDLHEVRTVVGRIGSPRLHVVDPECAPFHNVDVLQHAVTVVSSPTSLLAELAGMSKLPILLALPDTAYYHGQIIEDLFRPFCIVVEDVSQIEAAVEEAFRANEGGVGALAASQRAALTYAFGEPDGRSADRLVEGVLQRLEAESGTAADFSSRDSDARR